MTVQLLIHRSIKIQKECKHQRYNFETWKADECVAADLADLGKLAVGKLESSLMYISPFAGNSRIGGILLQIAASVGYCSRHAFGCALQEESGPPTKKKTTNKTKQNKQNPKILTFESLQNSQPTHPLVKPTIKSIQAQLPKKDHWGKKNLEI